MMNNCKDFKIVDLFNVTLSKDDLQPNKLNAGEFPLISSGKTNNGVVTYIEHQPQAELYNKGCITVDMFGKSFYQNEDFYCVSHGRVNILVPKLDLSENVCLFISTVIDKSISGKYSFKKMCSSKAISQEVISLPINEDNSLNTSYMEEYINDEIKNVERINKSLTYALNCKNNEINTKQWKAFKIGDIFENIVSPKVYHVKDVEQDINGIPYVVRTKFNNGVKYRVKKLDKYLLNPGGTISFGAENATFFYQPEDFISGRDMYYIDTRNLSKECALFVTTCLQKITDKYSYNYGLFPKLLKEETIKLPITEDEQPDWKYMENFIESLPYGNTI